MLVYIDAEERRYVAEGKPRVPGNTCERVSEPLR